MKTNHLLRCRGWCRSDLQCSRPGGWSRRRVRGLEASGHTRGGFRLRHGEPGRWPAWRGHEWGIACGGGPGRADAARMARGPSETVLSHDKQAAGKMFCSFREPAKKDGSAAKRDASLSTHNAGAAKNDIILTANLQHRSGLSSRALPATRQPSPLIPRVV